MSLGEPERVGRSQTVHAWLLAKDAVYIHCTEEGNRLKESKEHVVTHSSQK